MIIFFFTLSSRGGFIGFRVRARDPVRRLYLLFASLSSALSLFLSVASSLLLLLFLDPYFDLFDYHKNPVNWARNGGSGRRGKQTSPVSPQTGNPEFPARRLRGPMRRGTWQFPRGGRTCLRSVSLHREGTAGHCRSLLGGVL